MGSPDKRCGLCRLYRRGRPPGVAVKDWAPQHGTCLRDEEPGPTHANCCACKDYRPLFPKWEDDKAKEPEYENPL